MTVGAIKCSKAIQDDAEKNPLKEHWFIQCIYKKTDKIFKGVKLDKDRPYIEMFIEVDVEEKSIGMMDNILAQDGYKSMPFADWPHWL